MPRAPPLRRRRPLPGRWFQPCDVTCSGTAVACGEALQTALDGGGTLYVCPGVYQGNFTITEAVTVIGAGQGNGDRDTILRGNGGRVLSIADGVGAVMLRTLRITGGAADGGAGVRHSGTSLTMIDCTVTDNTATGGGGGGIAAVAGSMRAARGGIRAALSADGLVMTGCTVTDNHALTDAGGSGGDGGGLTLGTLATLTNCSISANTASRHGGGLYVSGGLSVVDSDFRALADDPSPINLIGGTLANNTAAGSGGGIFNEGSVMLLTDGFSLTRNMASDGGGIFNAGGTVTLSNGASITHNEPVNCSPVGSMPGCDG